MRREAFESAYGRASREWARSTLEVLRAQEEREAERRRKNREGFNAWRNQEPVEVLDEGLGGSSEWDEFVRLFDDISEGGYNDCYWRCT